MPRRTIISVKEIYKRRASAWEWHYNNRKTARSAGMNTEHIAQVVQRCVPRPVMRIDGTLSESIAVIKGVDRAINELNFTYLLRDLMCSWYWSQAGWDDFVAQFQSLPEPTENHYLSYEPESDTILIVPLSQREPNSNKGTKKVQKGTSALLVPFEAVIQ